MMKKNYKLFCLLILVSNFLFSQISFENNAIQLGVDFSCGSSLHGNGVTFHDFDNDGWDDITFASDDTQELLFYKNNNGNFTSLDLNLPLSNYQTKQTNWIDFDNDGDKDLYVTSNLNGSKLFENLGALNFQDITLISGLPIFNMYTNGASWGDYNNDGYIDVFLSNKDLNTSTQTPNYLYKNNGDGTFTDVSVIAGIDGTNHQTFCSIFFDFNNDGWQDIYLSNDRVENLNQLYKNNGDGTFTEIGVASGTGIAVNSMTTTVGDYDNDGWFDIYITDIGDSVFLKNNGDETFTNIALPSGTIFGSVGWGAIFLDADNDTDLDLYVSGSLYDNPTYLSAAFYENMGNGTFQIPNNSGFENDNFKSHSNAVGDINNDGLPDFVVANGNNQNIALWENKNLQNNNWLKVNLEGTISNKDGVGSLIEISINGEKQYRYTHCGEGYLAQSSGAEFFGLGTSTSIDYIKVKWLSGIEDVFNNVASNQVLNIVENTSPLSVKDYSKTNFTIYPNPVNDILNIKSENEIIDLQVYNIIGKKIVEFKDVINNQIQCNTLQSGAYFIKITTDKNVETLKFIKN